MKLLTEELKTKLQNFPLYSQDKKADEAKVICKFFTPVGEFRWYVIEGEFQENDWIFFGLVFNGDDSEYGYFSLNELTAIKLPFGLTIERDLYFSDKTISEVKKLHR